MAITIRSVLDGGGGGESAECILNDGMLSDASAYLTVNLPKSLVEGDIYGISIKATNDNDPEGQMAYKRNSYPFLYNGSSMTLSFTLNKGATTIEMEIYVRQNQLEMKRYSGSWQYIWCKLYHYPVPSEANY